RPFAKDDAPGVSSHNGVVRIGTYELNQALPMRTVDPNLHLSVIRIAVNDLFWDIVQHTLPAIGHTIPDNPLGLCETWKKVVVRPRLHVRPLDHIVPHRGVFATPAMHNPACVAYPVV